MRNRDVGSKLCLPLTMRVAVQFFQDADDLRGRAPACARQLDRKSEADVQVCHGNVIRHLVSKALGVGREFKLRMSVGGASLPNSRRGPGDQCASFGPATFRISRPNLRNITGSHTYSSSAQHVWFSGAACSLPASGLRFTVTDLRCSRVYSSRTVHPSSRRFPHPAPSSPSCLGSASAGAPPAGPRAPAGGALRPSSEGSCLEARPNAPAIILRAGAGVTGGALRLAAARVSSWTRRADGAGA